MVVIHAYHRPRPAVLDDMVVQRAHATQRVHPRDGLVHYRAAWHHPNVPRPPRVPGDRSPGRVRADVRQNRVGGDVERLLLLAAGMLISAPAIAHDVQHDEPVRQIIAEVSGRTVVRPCVRHRVLRNGEIAGRIRSGRDVWEVQPEDGAARRADILHDKVRIAAQSLAARVEYVVGVQKFVTEW